ncbi:hypothetical protein [Sphingopyxis sp.]|jgi:hypothetical protein|uniref:hypothetical protein n=1 Tax=Sphingopyxis sp. TaxID=1908224 RepID=UPI002DEFD4A1|nr:hypothetical protein [Sphingopyxis sp.]
MDEDDFAAAILAEDAFREGGAAGLAVTSGDEDPTLRFFDNLRRTALASFDLGAGDGLVPSVFVLSNRTARTDARTLDSSATRLADINLRSPDEWQGKLVFTAAHGTGGWAIPLPDNSADAAIDLLEANGFGELPIAVIYPEARTLSCYQEGGTSEKAPIQLVLPSQIRPVTINDIFEVLEHVRRNGLLTPQVGPPGFWANPATYEPGPEAERTIQWIVAMQLSSSFRPIQVEPEQQVALGRIDLVMTNPKPTAEVPLHPAVIELKALKSRSNGGAPFAASKNIRAVVKGMRQAKSYREEKEARYSVLGCFDLRQNKDDILAADLCILARNRYFTDDRVEAFVLPLYANTGDAQEAAAVA